MDISAFQQALAPELSANFSGPTLYIILIGIGSGIGFLTGVFGVGGGFLIVPLLNVLVGIPYDIAVGSSLSFILGTSTAGYLRHAKHGNVQKKVILGFALGSMPGAVIGDVFQDKLIQIMGNSSIVNFTSLMHMLFLLLLAVTIYFLLNNIRKKEVSIPLLQKIHFGQLIHIDETHDAHVPLFCVIFIGIFLGIMTGIMGIGGGILIVPILLIAVGLRPEKAAGTSLGIIFCSALASTIKKGLSSVPEISLPVTLSLLAASVIGVQIGAVILHKFNTKNFEKYFSIVVFAAMILVGFDLIDNF